MLLRSRSHPQDALSVFGALGIEPRASVGGGFADKAPNNTDEDAVGLYARIRYRSALHRAWAKVRTSGLKSDSQNTKSLTLQFDDNWVSNLERIARRLKDHKFKFIGEKGITPAKGKGKKGVRPLVLAPIDNRIVRRAILEVLQGYGASAVRGRSQWQGVPAIRSIMETPTSIGGIAGRGVPEGLALMDQAIQSGKHWFIRSDIRDFFTRIPKTDVNAFVRTAVNDDEFADFFEEALATNLENQEELEERKLFKLFPDPEIGVAQGSALSALAGNIALRDFDAEMNCRGIMCIRYIDDFILLGPSRGKVVAAYKSARDKLKTMRMDVYEVEDAHACSAGKVDHGNIHDGTDFLGYRISGRSLQPCRDARTRFLAKIDKVVNDAQREMKSAAECSPSSHRRRYHQSMVEIHKIVWGWSQSFRHTTANHVFAQLDDKIDRRISELESEACRLAATGDARTRRRVMGLHLLQETPLEPLPGIPA